VLSYDRGGGLTFAHADMQADFGRALEGYDTFHGTSYTRGLPRNPDGVLNILDNYVRLRLLDRKSIALIIDFAETIAPAGEAGGMAAEDRNALVILKRWAQNSAFLNADITICLIGENQVELNLGLVQNPGVALIQIPLPGETERLEFIQAQLARNALPEGSDVSVTALAKLTSGLKRVQIQSLIAGAVENRRALTWSSCKAASIFRWWPAMNRLRRNCRMPRKSCGLGKPTCCPWATSSAAPWARARPS
jgi:hypothetical protein